MGNLFSLPFSELPVRKLFGFFEIYRRYSLVFISTEMKILACYPKITIIKGGKLFLIIGFKKVLTKAGPLYMTKSDLRGLFVFQNV